MVHHSSRRRSRFTRNANRHPVGSALAPKLLSCLSLPPMINERFSALAEDPHVTPRKRRSHVPSASDRFPDDEERRVVPLSPSPPGGGDALHALPVERKRRSYVNVVFRLF